jgi:zinc transport system ATP-binding protein
MRQPVAHQPHGHKHDGEVLLRCRGLVVGWHDQGLLPPIDLELRRDRVVAVVGRNGAGKTTWFKTLLGLCPPVTGRVEHALADLRLAYVPQSSTLERLLPLTAREVVMQGRLRGWSFLHPLRARADRDACERALADAEASDLAGAPIRELSKGQRQRVLLARMLATECDLALLDEPTAAMDMAAEREALDRLHRLAHERNMAVVVVCHAVELATEFADHLLLLDRAAGVVLFGERDEVIAHEVYCRYYHGKDAAHV